MSSSSLDTTGQGSIPFTHGIARPNDASLLHGLNFLQLELTNRCNLKCIHCYSESAPHSGDADVLTKSDYKQLIGDAYDLGARNIQFLGGEPTLSRDLGELIEHSKMLGYEHIEIYSNLTTRITQELIDYASRMDVRFATSFYSCDETREDEFTGVKGSYQRKVRNLEAILAHGLPVRGTLIIADQPKDDIEATIAFAHELGLRSVNMDRIRDFGRAREQDNVADVGELCGNCWKGSLAISADGSTYACPFARDWPVGNVTTSSLSNILKGVALKSIRNRVFDAMTHQQSEMEACGPCGPCAPSGQCGPCGPCLPSGQCGPCGPLSRILV